MAVDMSNIQRSMVQNAFEHAKRLEQEDSAEVAAQAWESAAEKVEDFARRAVSKSDRRRRMERAHACRQRATELRAALASRPSRQPTNGSAESDTADEFRSAARNLIHRSSITFGQIAGQQDVINDIRRAMAFAQARPPEGVQAAVLENILMSGPPGCGKTLLAAAMSNGLHATFFSVKVSDLLSRYYGDSPRLLKALYEVAAEHPFSVVFIDEIDAFAMNRSGNDSAADRRLLNSLLTELDGMNQKGTEHGTAGTVVTIAATNRPWDLDQASLSRFGRHVYTGLPDEESRRRLLELELTQRGFRVEFTQDEWLAATRGLSGREISALCRQMIRRMFRDANPDILDHADAGRDSLQAYQTRSAPLTGQHLQEVRKTIKPQTTQATLEAFKHWNDSH